MCIFKRKKNYTMIDLEKWERDQVRIHKNGYPLRPVPYPTDYNWTKNELKKIDEEREKAQRINDRIKISKK